MTLRDDNDGLAAHEKQAWDAIVADLSGQVDLGPEFRPDPVEHPEHEYPEPEHPDDVWLDEGYTPPEPPPLPRPRDPVQKASWAGVIGGPTIIVLKSILGWGGWLTWVGVAASVAGFATLIARMADHRDDDDDGAVV